MTALRWIAFSLLALLGSHATICNCVGVAQSHPGRSYSVVLLLGGGMVAIGLAAAPLDVLNRLWWIPLIADLGCLPILTMTVGYLAYLAWRALRGRE